MVRGVYPTKEMLLNQVRKAFYFISAIHYGDILISARMQHFVMRNVKWKRVEMRIERGESSSTGLLGEQNEIKIKRERKTMKN